MGRLAFDLAVFGQHFDDLIHHAAAFVDVRVLPAPERDSDLHLVVVLQKANRLLDLEFDIMFACFRPQADFLELRMMLLALGLPFGLLIFKFAEVHDPADGRLGFRRNLDQIQASFTGLLQCLLGREYP